VALLQARHAADRDVWDLVAAKAMARLAALAGGDAAARRLVAAARA
jgi:hypothetical protein